MFKRHARSLESASMVLMMLGIVALCQPWNLLVHEYSVALILFGLIAFNVFSRMSSAAAEPADPGQVTEAGH